MSRFTLPEPNNVPNTGRRWIAIGALLTGSLFAAGAGAAERATLLRYSVPVPARWQPQTPASSFRLAQFRVPAAPGASDGEAVIFHFGAGQGGSAAANIARWSSQFTSVDGKPVTPRRETFSVGGLPVTVVDLSGTYARGVGGIDGAPKPNQKLLAALVEAPEGNVIFQLHGDGATVEANRPAFFDMIHGWKP